MKEYEIVLFDLDGTLTDPKEGITKSVSYALAKMGIVENDLEKLTPFIGPPLEESFREFYQMDAASSREALKHYREYFSVTGMYENQVYTGIPDLLEKLKAKGKILGVATSKPTVFSEQILRHFSLHSYFTFISGSNLDGSRVLKKEVIEYALASLSVNDRKQVLMIGDRKHDVIGARATEVDCAAVCYGYGSQEELTKARPDYLVKSVEELEELIIG